MRIAHILAVVVAVTLVCLYANVTESFENKPDERPSTAGEYVQPGVQSERSFTPGGQNYPRVRLSQPTGDVKLNIWISAPERCGRVFFVADPPFSGMEGGSVRAKNHDTFRTLVYLKAGVPYRIYFRSEVDALDNPPDIVNFTYKYRSSAYRDMPEDEYGRYYVPISDERVWGVKTLWVNVCPGL